MIKPPRIRPRPGGYRVDGRDDDTAEAIAQFYLNWQKPHTKLAGDRRWKPFRLRDLDGVAATMVDGAPDGSACIQVEEFADLTGIAPAAAGEHVDLLVLQADTARSSRTYRITGFDAAARTFTVDGVPALPGPSAWMVRRRPFLVAVDPFAGRMDGQGASTAGLPDRWVALPDADDLNRIRANFDTVYLAGDTGRPSRTYRVVEVHPTEPRVRLDLAPKLPTRPTPWQICAGVGRAVLTNPLAVGLDLTPAGFDAYDGLLFLVEGNDLQTQVAVTSYSSTVNSGDPVLGSSITGNLQYTVRSLRSPTASARNYELAVTDPNQVAADGVAAAAFYSTGVTAMRAPATETPTVPADPDGKLAVRIHVGNTTGFNSGSGGDLVALDFPSLRASLIALHQAGRRALGLADDPDLAAVAAATTQAASVALYDGGTVGDQQYNDKLQAVLVLIRPDLRPTTS